MPPSTGPIMKRTIFTAFLAIVNFLAGCSSMNLWPFERSAADSRPGQRGPENAVEFRCEGGKSFHVRYLEGNRSAWIFFTDRQVRLDKIAGDAEGRYSNGIATLVVQGLEATLTDGPTITYNACKSMAAGGK